MPRRFRVLAVSSVIGVVLLGMLSACGEGTSGKDSADEPASGAFDNLTISDNFGEKPTVEFDGAVEAEEIGVKTIVEGTGDPVGEGQSVLTHLWLGNGVSKEEVFSSYGEGNQPEMLTVGSKDLLVALRDGISDQPVGSRVAVVAPPKDAFGENGNPSLGIGNADTVVFVIDLLQVLPDGPDGTEATPAAWAPTVVETDGAPTELDFAGTPEPSSKLRVTSLVVGTGPKVEKGQTIWVNYLGQVYGGKKPFDESYSRGTPFSFPIGAGQVVKGWDQGLEGVPVGSRVIVAIPPKKGYGEQGNEQAGIKGTDTLYFVVDVLGAV